MSPSRNPLRALATLCAHRLRAGVADLGLSVAIGLCLVAAAGYGLSAVHGLLRPIVGAAGASGILAASLLIIALALALWLSLRRRERPAILAAPSPAPDFPIAPPAGGAGESMAFLAGFLLARRLF